MNMTKMRMPGTTILTPMRIIKQAFHDPDVILSEHPGT